jgi:hypothetical protein
MRGDGAALVCAQTQRLEQMRALEEQLIDDLLSVADTLLAATRLAASWPEEEEDDSTRAVSTNSCCRWCASRPLSCSSSPAAGLAERYARRAQAD